MRVLISPLDWGLGHATRCVPVIRALRGAGHEVFIYASGAGYRLLRAEFPDLEIGELPSYSMRYARSRILTPLLLFAQLPLFFLAMLADARHARALVGKHRIDRLVSDGRYGFRAGSVPCVFITHQLAILPPGPAWFSALLAAPLMRLNRWALRGFAAIWVPDFSGPSNLSGRLGHPDPAWDVEYTGPLCRFRPEGMAWDQSISRADTGPRIDVLALVSGPEPQRSLFEEALRTELRKSPGTRVLVRGLPGAAAVGKAGLAEGELNVFDHLPESELLALLTRAERVVCRSGYTSVMELAGLGRKNALLVPTPGQPEQEYLAKHLQASGFARAQTQDQLDLSAGASGFGPGFPALTQAASERPRPLSEFIARHPLFTETPR